MLSLSTNTKYELNNCDNWSSSSVSSYRSYSPSPSSVYSYSSRQTFYKSDGITKWDIKHVNNSSMVEIPVDVEPRVIYIAMGKSGNVFKDIQVKSGVRHIWYKEESKIIEIYGKPWKYNDALEQINNRIKIAEQRFFFRKKEIYEPFFMEDGVTEWDIKFSKGKKVYRVPRLM